MRTLFMLFVALALPAVEPIFAAASIAYEANALATATNALNTLKILGQKDFAALGFASTNEVNIASNGAPFQVYRMALASVQTFATADPYNGLLEFDALTQTANRLIFPVMVYSKAKSSITLRLEGTNWVVDKIGPANLSQSLLSARGAVPAASLQTTVPPFAVEFPLFDMWWVGYYDTADALKLITTRNLPLSAPVGPFVQMPSAAMLEIGTIAQRYNEKPN